MSGNRGMRGVCEGKDQKNFTEASLRVEQKGHNMNAAGYMPSMPFKGVLEERLHANPRAEDQARAMNEMRGGDVCAEVHDSNKHQP